MTILALMTMAPALAATTVAQASANALTIAVAGNGQGSGTVTATHDGKQESVRGETAPPVQVLGNQQLVNSGSWPRRPPPPPTATVPARPPLCRDRRPGRVRCADR